MTREIREERGVDPTAYKQIGMVEEIETDGVLIIRHVFLITGYEGDKINNEARNKPFWATLDEAEEICEHPISKDILTLVRNALNAKE